VAPHGSAYLRLWFNTTIENNNNNNNNNNKTSFVNEVFLFLNDAESGQNEECYLFKINNNQ
jgi:hypothetical protein